MKYLIWIILGVYFFFNLFTLPMYGMQWDEPVQHHLGQVSLDYAQGKTQDLKFARDDLHNYGPFLEMINVTVGNFLINGMQVEYTDAHHFFLIITTMIGFYFLYRLNRKLFDEKVAIASVIFLMLLPRFLTHSIINSKDIPLALFPIVVIYFLYLTYINHKFIYALLAGLFFGWSLAIQVTSLMILPIFFLPFLITNLKDFKTIQEIKLSAVFILTTAIITIISWPFLWIDPTQFLKSIQFFTQHGWSNNVLYLGKIYTATGLPWHYPLFYIFMTIPIFVLLFLIIGVSNIIKSTLKDKKLTFPAVLLLCWIFIPLLVYLKPDSVKYDGVRHYFFVFPPLITLAAIGFCTLLKYITPYLYGYKKEAYPIFLSLIATVLFINVMTTFPYGDSYFNEPTLALLGDHAEEKVEVEYWGTTYREAMQWINTNVPENSVICVPIATHLLQAYPIRPDIKIECPPGETTHLMLFTRLAYYPPDLNDNYPFKGKQPIYTISRLGSDLLQLYKL